MIDRIEGPRSPGIRSGQVSQTRSVGEGAHEEEAAASSAREDHVDISPQGRAMAAGAEPSEVAGLSVQRLAEIQRRLANGTYDSPEVVDVVVQRMIQQGDL